MNFQKKSFVENDVVLIYVDNQPVFFARLEMIAADAKKGWWHVTFLMLKIPLTTFTWILDNEQIRGAEFTMQGTPMRIEKVTAPSSDDEKTSEPEEQNGTDSEQGRILSMRKKNT